MIPVAIFIIQFCLVKSVPVADIITVDFICGATASDTSRITVTADRYVKVSAHCKDDYTFPLATTDTVHFIVDVSYSGTSSQSCVFRKIADSDVFDIDLLIGRQTDPQTASVLQYRNRYTATCKLDAQGTQLSGTEVIDMSKLPAKEIIRDIGSIMSSTVNLLVKDVDDIRLVGLIPVGRVVRIHGVVTVSGGETGIKALSCHASNDILTYPILIGGCGDGTVISKSKGFVTTGTDIYSPYFTTFRLQGSDQIFYVCNFTACTVPGGCDGDSCEVETSRRKRSAVQQGIVLYDKEIDLM